MVYNINGQNRTDCQLGLKRIFDLQSYEDYHSRTEKISTLYDTYGVNNELFMKDEWNGLRSKLTTKEDFIVQNRTSRRSLKECGRF